ncbi:MAG: phage terminase large subunit [Acidobacteria bacterium]|nr:phage terminase large subunit [Acidobacteriota bacterium]
MNWDWPYQRYIQQKLQEVTDGTCKRLMIFLPPRHGKSELVTVRYAAWRLRQNPAMNVILASYNQQLANRFSRKIKTVLCDDFSRSAGCQPALAAPAATPRNADTPVRTGRTAATPRHSSLDTHYSTESPFPFTRPRPKNTEAEWETTHGGGLRAVGVGAGITGFGANLIIVDDPVKSRAEAESAAYRERLFDWFSDDLYTRLEPGGAMIVIQTRWHEDDLSGRLLSQMSDLTGEPWDVISLPAIAEHKGGGLSVSEGVTLNASPEESSVITSPLSPNDYSGEASSNSHFSHLTSHIPTDVLGRAPGEPLCPDRFNIAELNRIRQKMGTYSFSALFQQTPVPAEGGIFKKEWFKIVDSAPKNLRWMRGYDLAMKKGESNDFTASFRVGFDRKTGIYYIDGGFRKRIEYPDQRRYILGRIMAEPDTTHGIEATANGNAVIQDLRRDIQTQGRAFRAVDVKGDKTTRALVWSALLESGHAFLVRGPWNDDLIAECCSFPSAAHDDQIDAVSLAFQMHRRGRFAGHGF